jgi:two-component system cell cycle sensor histidine kinase/response regulator CckA
MEKPVAGFVPTDPRLPGIPVGSGTPVAAVSPFRSGSLRAEGGEALALRGMAHDARNLVTALRLCSELLAEAGVLSESHRHFATDVRSIADGSEQLARRLSRMAQAAQRRGREAVVEEPITDVPGTVRHLSGLLSALAGPSIGIEIACLPCRGTIRMGEENLTRILVNLVRNAGEAMPSGGQVRITVQRGDGSSFFWALRENDVASGTADLWDDTAPAQTVLLAVEDDGPGIPEEWRERVFEPGFSTRRDGRPWPQTEHPGLGLSLVRTLVEEAGGTIRAAQSPDGGARLEIALPLTNVTLPLLSEGAGEGEAGGE